MIETNGYRPLEETKDHPCPFCGDERSCFIESLPDSFLDEYTCWIECVHCGAQGSVAVSFEAALAYWRNRGGKKIFRERADEREPEFIIEPTAAERTFIRLLRRARKKSSE